MFGSTCRHCGHTRCDPSVTRVIPTRALRARVLPFQDAHTGSDFARSGVDESRDCVVEGFDGGLIIEPESTCGDAWGRVSTGAVLGQPSAQDVQDLVKAKDYQIGRIIDGYQAVKDAWDARDHAGHADWLIDWQNLEERYRLARLAAMMAIDTPFPKVAPAPGEWRLVLSALKQKAQFDFYGNVSGPTTKGDMQDLYERLEKGAAANVTFPDTPQPTPGGDVDLNVMNTLAKLPVPEPPSLPTVGWALGGAAVLALLVMLLVVVRPTVHIGAHA
jgi:hypothetical protein